MTGAEAHQLHVSVRQHGIPRSVDPADPARLDGDWLVVDEDGRDVTSSAYARVLSARQQQPQRGFVVAR
ncbi:hypothetical protein [Streptomyces subrutilus]|uniref:Uncharacterized protein n=1 Tax=Streptomyces subrutilus TaxID=36818 RepID=A0A918UZM9_9ACTN|nr:hypothetical protein OG479_32670 [Streptomyces subrutilus]GGZ45881.1 hypothetical protein GCM10010371_01150 [Streptomyces subrutilus]